MDASITDILASVTRSHETSTTPAYPSTSSPQTDLQHLTRAWVAERSCPEILPYPTELLDRVMQRIRAQIETIEDRTARMDAGTSFALVVMQTELERFKFLVRSFLRARIAKIDSHPHYLLSLPPSTPSLLSPQEAQYLLTHATLLSNHYTSSFLSSFPSKLRRLDDRAGAGGVGMVEGPDLGKAVFVRCLGVAGAGFADGDRTGGDEDMDVDMGGRWGGVEVSCGFTGREDAEEDEGERGRGGERIVSMRRGEVWLVRWSSVRDAVARGECELI